MLINPGFSSLCFSKLFFTGLFVSSAATVPGVIYLNKKSSTQETPKIEVAESPRILTEEEKFNAFGMSFDHSDFALRREKFEAEGMQGPWIKMPWEEGYDWVEARDGWINSVNRYMNHHNRSETTLYKYIYYASQPLKGKKAAFPEIKDWLNDMNVERLITICNRLWTQVGPNRSRISAARGWCVDSREIERRREEELARSLEISNELKEDDEIISV